MSCFWFSARDRPANRSRSAASTSKPSSVLRNRVISHRLRFLLHPGQFHRVQSTPARAFPSTSCHRGTPGGLLLSNLVLAWLSPIKASRLSRQPSLCFSSSGHSGRQPRKQSRRTLIKPTIAPSIIRNYPDFREQFLSLKPPRGSPQCARHRLSDRPQHL